MVLINCEIDEPTNQLRVTFPTRAPRSTIPTPSRSLAINPRSGSGDEQAEQGQNDPKDPQDEGELPGFNVDLRVDGETMSTWEK